MFCLLLRGMFSETNLYNINKNKVSGMFKTFHTKRWHLYIAIATLNPSIYLSRSYRLVILPWIRKISNSCIRLRTPRGFETTWCKIIPKKTRKWKDQRKLRILDRNCDVLRYIFPEAPSFPHERESCACCTNRCILRSRPSGQHIKCLSFSSTRCFHVAH